MHNFIITALIIVSTTSYIFAQDIPNQDTQPIPTSDSLAQQTAPTEETAPQQELAPLPQDTLVQKPGVVTPQPLPLVEEATPSLQSQSSPQFAPLNSNDSTAPGILVITSFPEDTKISLNGVEVGTGAVTVPDLLPGRYVITATDGERTEMEEVVIAAGGLTKQDIAVKKKTHMYISMSNMVTIFKDDQGNGQVALGPHFEIGVSIRSKLLITQDFHWGFWSKSNDTTSSSDHVSTDGQYTAAGGNIKVFWQTMTPKEHFGFFLGAGMGFYSINDYYSSYYYDTPQLSKSSFNGDYFGGPSAMFIFGGPIAYGTLSYDLRIGSGVAHSIKLGIATYF